MAKLIRLKLYICDFYENLDQKTMEVIIHRALNGTAGSAMTDIFEIEEKAITWADDNPINQLNATQETWDEQFGSKNTQAARIAELEKMAEARKFANHLLEQERNELEAERDRLRETLQDEHITSNARREKIIVLKAERDRLREALKEVLNCEVVTDTGDYSKGGTGFDCNEVKEIIRGALAE
ncbi:MAG: hypothetical protein HP002_09555 [Lentisphaeria bacterium]|nr:hypothetical protein [Lentisphaeria bacterium]